MADDMIDQPPSMAMGSADDLEQKLTCSICLQVFRDPRLLPCGHTFCQHCLTSYINSKSPANNPRGQQGFLCPVCREFVAAPDRITPPQLWACKFKPNFLIRDIVEVHGKSKQRVQRPPCPRHPGKSLELYCRDCRASVCDRCVALQHRKCEEVLELAEVSRESQQASRKHQHTVTRLLKQLDAKKRRCSTGRRELERIERDMDAKIEREGQEILRKVADFVRSRKEALKRQAHAHCRQCVNVVNAYTEKCEELTGALRALDRVLNNRLRPDRPQNKHVDEQEAVKLSGMVQKLEVAVQQLDSPCHFTVRLIMDDSALTAILANLKLGEIRTGDQGQGLGRAGDQGLGASGRPSAASAASTSVLHSGRSTPDRPASAAASLPSSPTSSLSSLFPAPFSLNSAHFVSNSSLVSPSSASFSPNSASFSFSSCCSAGGVQGQRSGSGSLRNVSMIDSEGAGPGKGAEAGSAAGLASSEARSRKSVSKAPYELKGPPPYPLRRKLSQP